MPKLLALDGGEDVAGGVGALHGVAHPAAEDGSATGHGGSNEAIEIAVGQAGAGSVMHQHPLPLRHVQRIEHGEGALGAPFHLQDPRIGGHGQGVEPAVMGSQRHYDLTDSRVGEQPGQGVLQNGHARQLQILFRALGPHPAADAGGRHDGGQPAVMISHRRLRLRSWNPCLCPWE